MPLDDESSSSTHHGMTYREYISTNASRGRVRYVPVIAEMNGIPESLLFKVKFISFNKVTVDAPFSAAKPAAL